MGWFKRTFHPGKCAREKETEAQEARNSAAAQAAQQQAAAELRKQEAFEAIQMAFDEAKEKVESWYTSEVAQAEEDYAKKQADYLQTLEELSQAVGQARSNIESGFCEQQSKIWENQKEEEHKLEACRSEIVKLAGKYKEDYGQNRCALDNLWQQVESSMLHTQCQDSYTILKQPENTTSKSRHYSRLMAYLRHFSDQDFLTRADFERYTKFLDSLYHSHGELEKDKNFNSIDSEINLLFARAKNNDRYLAADAYQADRDVVKQTYAVSKEFSEALSIKLNMAEQENSVRHTQAMMGLSEEKEKKLNVITNNYSKIQSDIETEKKLYQEKYDAYLFALGNDRGAYLAELETNENQERERVGEQYEAELAYIQDAVRKAISEIDSVLSQQLKQIKSYRFSAIVNFCTAIFAGVGAYFANTFLAGAAPFFIDAVETSLTLTSLGAAVNMVNGKDAVGFKISANLNTLNTSTNVKPFRTDDDVSDNQKMDDIHVNLKNIRDQFNGFSKNIEEWQSQAEHHLFYALKRNVKQPKPDFSKSMTAFFGQNQNTHFSVQLGTLDAQGWRTVSWNSGRAVMFDTDVRMMLKRMAGVHDEVFRNDWKKPQVFSFDRNAFKQIKDRMSQEEYLTFSGVGAIIGLGGQALHDDINGDDWFRAGIGAAKAMATNAGIYALSQVPNVEVLDSGNDWGSSDYLLGDNLISAPPSSLSLSERVFEPAREMAFKGLKAITDVLIAPAEAETLGPQRERREHVFQPLYRAHRAKEPKFETADYSLQGFRREETPLCFLSGYHREDTLFSLDGMSSLNQKESFKSDFPLLDDKRFSTQASDFLQLNGSLRERQLKILEQDSNSANSLMWLSHHTQEKMTLGRWNPQDN